MDLGLKGLHAIVTGGSKGIGRRAAEIFAQEGASVAICARNADEVKAAVESLKAKGVDAFGAGLDVADKAALENRRRQRRGARRPRHPRRQRFGPRRARHRGIVAQGIRSRHDRHGALSQCRAAVSRKAKAPSIVTISSVSGREVDFAARPMALSRRRSSITFRSLAYQYAPKGIRANAVSPGNIYFEGGVWEVAEKICPPSTKCAFAQSD